MFDQLVPEGLRPKLLQSTVSAKISSVVSVLEEHFRLAGVPFFKEYTDHSFQHSIDVFRSACDILTERALEVISSDDLNILLLSCVLHDAGLHVTEDVFIALTDPANTTIANPSLDTKSWPELWNDYLGEAKRFNAKKLQSLFGDTQAIREPPRKALDMTQRDRMLIGDFLRKHHPRYAHDLAKHAIPDTSGSHFQLDGLDVKTRDLAGLIARSHGLELRSIFDYVKDNYDLRDYNRIHIIFLMVLLRIADYMQIQSARAPQLFGKLHKIRSPFSLGEWRVHQCITNVNAPSFDPEAIAISAEPKSVHEYLRFEEWITGLQSELDNSWAILGEIYGRFTQEALDKLQLRIRRLRSNIEDKAAFQKRVRFVPERIQFSVSEPELLRLLMEPLYGENPLYGLRELTQNASDSVKEFEYLKNDLVGTFDRLKLIDNADIEIELGEEPSWHFVMRDRGTGMTLQTIKNYFLKAGASFRNSDLWKHTFQNEDGKSQIARTGRFGVGALSAYLIGEKIDVYSRHYSDKTGFGYKFEAKIDEDEIEIANEAGPIGTTIRIWSDEKKISHIKKYLSRLRQAPFFYVLPHPRLQVAVASSEKEHIGRETFEPRWIKAESSRYAEVEWDRTIPNATREHEIEMGYLYCNGIIVGDIDKPSKSLLFDEKTNFQALSINAPTVRVTDYDANLPLDLARKGLSSKDNDLAECVRTSICEQTLAEIFSAPAETPSEIMKWWSDEHRMINSYWWNPFFFGSEGFSLLDANLLNDISPKSLAILLQNMSLLDQLVTEQPDDFWFALRRGSRTSKTDTLSMLRDDSFQKYPSLNGSYYYRMPFKEVCYLIEKKPLEEMLQLSNVANYVRDMRNSQIQFKVGKEEFCILNRSTTKSFVKDVSAFAQRVLASGLYNNDWRSPAIFLNGFVSFNTKETPISKTWKASFDLPYIPYEIGSRDKILRKQAPVMRYL